MVVVKFKQSPAKGEASSKSRTPFRAVILAIVSWSRTEQVSLAVPEAFWSLFSTNGVKNKSSLLTTSIYLSIYD